MEATSLDLQHACFISNQQWVAQAFHSLWKDKSCSKGRGFGRPEDEGAAAVGAPSWELKTNPDVNKKWWANPEYMK